MEIRSKKAFVIIIITVILVNLTLLLNIPLLRPFIGFIFCSILPGILIIQLLKVDRINNIEKIALVIGLSNSFLMFFGIFFNKLSLYLGHPNPLSLFSLSLSFSVAFLVLATVGYLLNKNDVLSLSVSNLNTLDKTFLSVSLLFPAFSILGIHLMNTSSSSIFVILLLFLMPTYVVFICIFNQRVSNRVYPISIFLISLSILLLIPLRSNHIIGIDSHIEYYFFQTTLNNTYWSIIGQSTLDSSLSISLLPSIYQSMTNINSEILFKMMYPLFYSIAPLIIYSISEKYIGYFHAFLASCFFMFQRSFFMTTMNARTSLAVFFFALIIMVIFSDRINSFAKRCFLIIFMSSIIVSHYSTAYIFIFILFGSFMSMSVLSNVCAVEKIIRGKTIGIFIVFLFMWYSLVTETAFYAGINFIKDTIINLNQFLVVESSGGGVPALLGSNIVEKGLPHKIEFIFTWLAFAFIGIGIITSIMKYSEMSFPGLCAKKSIFLKEKFEIGYLTISLISAGLLLMPIIFPFVSKGYGIQRLFGTSSVILSIFFVIGGLVISKSLKIRPYLLILLILIPYFLSITGVTYQALGHTRSLTLNSEGEQYDLLYTTDQEVYGAKWLGIYAAKNRIIYAADVYGGIRLTSQGLIAPSIINTDSFIEHRDIEGYIYLRRYNIINGKLMDNYNNVYNMTIYQDTFTKRNEIYNTSSSIIYT